MRAAAGWPREGQCFHLRRDIDPPEALRGEVFPWVDNWLERYRLASLSDARLTAVEQGLGRLVAADGSQTRSLVRNKVFGLKTLVQQAIAQPQPLPTNVPPSALPAESLAAMLRGSPLPVLNAAALPPVSVSG